jgi:Cu(I)/Ag(I) efflux system membrane fusion protein
VFLVDAETRLAAGVPEPATSTQLAPSETAAEHRAAGHRDHQHGGGAGGPQPVPGQVQPLIQAYLALGDALVASDAKLALAKAAELRTAADKAGLPLPGLGDFPAELAAQRLRLGPLSEEVIALARRAGLSSDLQVVWCSMAPGRWLQRAGEVANPYYGQEMLRCGDIQGAPTAAPAQPPATEL